MKTKSIPFLALGLFLSLGRSWASDPSPARLPASKMVHNWGCIAYPMTVGEGWTPGDPFFRVGLDDKAQGLRLDIFGFPKDFFKTHHLVARLHRAGGEVVDPTDLGKKLLNAPIGVETSTRKGGEPDLQIMTFFPWGSNALEESWLEVSTGTDRYWLEIPYGFDRDPQDPLPPSTAAGPSGEAPAMKPPGSHDHQVRWRSVSYDVGMIQNGWRLTLIQTNPFDGQSEVVLYRDDTRVGKSMYLWDLHSPCTSVRVLGLDGEKIGGGSICTDIRLHEDGMRRSDIFQLGRIPMDGRSWGQVEITVDDKSYRVVVPSSLYGYTQGHAGTN